MADRPTRKSGSTALPPRKTGSSAATPRKTGTTPLPPRTPAQTRPTTVAPTAAKDVKAAARDAKRAERARKKASTDPADMGRVKQVQRAYQLTHEFDPKLPYLMIGALLLPVVVGVVLGVLTGHVIYAAVFGLLVGVLLAMIVLVRRAKGATYRRYAGQAGSAEVALQMLPKQWISTPVIAANRNSDVVHRTLGPGGLVLIGEGEPGRVRQLLAGEVRKHERVAYGVTVHTVVMGDKPGQVPLSRLADHIRKLPKTLQANQVTDVKARLRALDAVRPPIPIPKGPMPTSARQARGSRQAMRGR
jgi:F0F1-type ATP synthase assembly protein I